MEGLYDSAVPLFCAHNSQHRPWLSAQWPKKSARTFNLQNEPAQGPEARRKQTGAGPGNGAETNRREPGRVRAEAFMVPERRSCEAGGRRRCRRRSRHRGSHPREPVRPSPSRHPSWKKPGPPGRRTGLRVWNSGWLTQRQVPQPRRREPLLLRERPPQRQEQPRRRVRPRR